MENGPPIPGNFHADAIEWVGVLKAVDSAVDTFTVAEIGAGYAPWIASAWKAFQRQGSKEFWAVAVEADKQHCDWIRRHAEINQVPTADLQIFQAAAISDGVVPISILRRKQRLRILPDF